VTDGRLAPEGQMRHLMAQRSPAERLRMCSRMLSTARTLALAGMASKCEVREASDQRRRIFLRFYGAEFTEQQRAAILAAIARVHRTP